MTAAAVIAVGAVLAGTVMAAAAPPTLPGRTAAQLLAEMQGARLPRAMTATVSETANLGFPALPDLPGLSSSATSATSLITGTHTIQIWYAGPRHVRIAVPVSFGETDLRIDGSQVWLWRSHGQTATRYVLPARPVAGHQGLPMPSGRPAGPAQAGPGPLAGLTPIQAVRRVLALAGQTTKIWVDGTTTVAGRSAYLLAIAPRASQSLIGRILIAVDAQTHLPLQLQVYARGQSGVAFQIGFTALSLTRPAAANFTFTPPAGAHVRTVTLGGKAEGRLPARGPALPSRRPAGALIAGTQVLGKGWLSVAVIPASQALAMLSGSGGSGPAAPQTSLHIVTAPAGKTAGQVSALAQALLRSATKVSGPWGSGRLLRTSLFSVLLTSKGEVLIGAVKPAVLLADAALVR